MMSRRVTGWYCPECGERWAFPVTARKGRYRLLKPFPWRSTTRPPSLRQYWPKDKACRNRWHIRRYPSYEWATHSYDLVDPADLPQVRNRPPKERKAESRTGRRRRRSVTGTVSRNNDADMMVWSSHDRIHNERRWHVHGEPSLQDRICAS